MDWSDIGNAIAKFAPILGGLFGGPAGAAIGGLVATALGVPNSPDAIQNAINTDPTAAQKIKQIEADQQVQLAQLANQLEIAKVQAKTTELQAVNTTMQTEAKGDHWPTYTWRPFIGFCTGTMVFGCYFILPLIHTPSPAVPDSVWLMLGGILGVASFWRGKAQAATPAAVSSKG